MSLKELTAQSHIDAEKHPFTVKLIAGELSTEVYANYLYNQYYAYRNLELLCDVSDIAGLARAEKIEQDLIEINSNEFELKLEKETADYIAHLGELAQDQLLAHVYVRHMGDLYGGQLIKTKVPGSGAMYEFDNRKETIEKLRAKLDVLSATDLAEEANLCFSLILKLFDKLANEYNLSTA